ncbi:calcium/sodium antiporter [Flammeovirga sp. SubArs3]|uniref:calcium/sodium antiporter n=1 Tax=Flammeovirga sp. SubArs3 TaxID=2995316 RepID=UPI00248CF7AB|nr:calcium/sodium antiporter [Flammeovirga sp. SubArs3]
MILSILLVAVGFTALIFGANWLVDGASSLAKKHNISDLAIGLTVVAFGTSMPELLVNVISVVNGHSDILLGNIVGSNNFNIFFILGVAGIIMPIAVKSSTAWKEIPISLFLTVLLLLQVNDYFINTDSTTHFLSRLDGALLFILFVLFLYYIFTSMKEEGEISQEQEVKVAKNVVLKIVGGLILLIAGGQFVVNNSIEIAQQLGVSEKIIGLTIVAIGTSLPELTTSVIAALKKNSDIAIGNVIGSNIFNILFILSVSSMIQPVEYNTKFNLDLYVLIGGTLLLFGMMFTGKKIKVVDRWEAIILLLIYIVYTGYLVMLES